jgi:hypothetical protein
MTLALCPATDVIIRKIQQGRAGPLGGSWGFAGLVLAAVTHQNFASKETAADQRPAPDVDC